MNDFPSFLAQTGPSAYTLTLSASAAETLMLCPAKYSWSRVTGIEAAAARAGMNYGKALHLLLANHYNRGGDAGEIVVAEHFAENPQPQLGSKGRPEWRTAARALQHFAAYREKYPAEDFEVLGVEEPFEVELGSFTMPIIRPGQQYNSIGGSVTTISVRFRGIRDLRVRWHDQLWVLDHKTSTEWSDLTVDEGRCSFQFQGYGWVEWFAQRQRQLTATTGFTASECASVLTPIGGVIGNYLISREPYSNPERKPTPRDLPRDQFERVPYPYSDAQLDEWHARAMDIARDIWRHWSEENWPQRSTACAHWGRCEYYRLCWETDPAYRMAAAMSADYRPRTPSPFEDETNGKDKQ